MASQSTTSRRRKLGKELRALREAHGMTIERVAEHLECSHPKISRIELGRQAIRKLDLRMLLDLYQVADETERAAFTALANGGPNERAWFEPYSDVLPPKFDTYLDLEGDAVALYNYGNTLIHGLLQTEDYARVSITTHRWDLTPDDIERLVSLRMERQSRLDRAGAVALWVILDEATLRRPVGGVPAMRAQLEHLATMMRRPNITIQILPFAAGAHIAMVGSFTILKLRDVDDVLYIDSAAGNLYLEQAEDVASRELMFNHLRAEALSLSDSEAFITAVLKELA